MIELTEAQIQKQVVDYLTRRGVVVWSTHDPRHRPSHEGVADIIGVMPGGQTIAVEVKRQGGKVTRLQTEFIEAVRDQGGIGLIAYCLDDVRDAVENRIRVVVP